MTCINRSPFFFNDTATTEIYCLSLHDALPISRPLAAQIPGGRDFAVAGPRPGRRPRSEEHTSELQSHLNLVCRLLLEKKINLLNSDRERGESLQSDSTRRPGACEAEPRNTQKR